MILSLVSETSPSESAPVSLSSLLIVNYYNSWYKDTNHPFLRELFIRKTLGLRKVRKGCESGPYPQHHATDEHNQ